MAIWQRFLQRVGLRPKSGYRIFKYEISETLQNSLAMAFQRQGRPVDQITSELVAAGLNAYRREQDILLAWDRLTLAEQQVAAFACLGYTNSAIAARLHKSHHTVKAQLHQAYQKLGVRDRSQLRIAFRDWDFSSWGPPARK